MWVQSCFKREEMTDKNKYKHVNWELISRYVSGEMNATETADFEQRMKDEPMYADVVAETRLDMDSIERFHQMEHHFDTHKAWKKLEKRIQPEAPANLRSVNFRKWSQLQVAAIILALVAFSFGGYLWINSAAVNEKTVIANWENQGKEVVLDDGSVVYLNAGATFTYPKKFKGNTRTVSLNGEAFFNITRNENCPFIIRANAAEIKVLGTSFNVQSSKNKTEVLVETGKVQLRPLNNEADKLLLEKGEIGSLQQAKLKKQNNPNPNYLSWKTRKLVFDATPLQDVMPIIEKTYGVDIELPVDLEALQLTSTFNHEPLEIILESIAKSFNLTYFKNGRSIVFARE